MWTAPYKLTPGQPELPEGEFLLPVCTNRERLARTLEALNAYHNLSDMDKEREYVWDIWEALAYVDDPTRSPCVPCTNPEAQCISFYPTKSPTRFEFSPGVVNGNQTEIPPPTGYAQHPFFTGNNYDLPGFSLLASDVIGDGNSFRPSSIGGIFQQILDSGLPRMRFLWTGAATIEIHFLKIPFGGSAVVRVDDGAQVDVYDLSGVALTDIAPSLTAILGLIEGITEFNFIPVQIVEFTVDTPGDHFIDVLFIPEIQFSVTPVRWGGGIRKVVICGTDVDCEQQECPDCPDCPGNPVNDCGCEDCGEISSDCGCEDCA